MDIMGYSEIVKPRPYMTPCVRTSVLRVVAKEPAIRPRRQRDPAFAISATLAYSLEPAVTYNQSIPSYASTSKIA
jgi:hypothetical protein